MQTIGTQHGFSKAGSREVMQEPDPEYKDAYVRRTKSGERLVADHDEMIGRINDLEAKVTSLPFPFQVRS